MLVSCMSVCLHIVVAVHAAMHVHPSLEECAPLSVAVGVLASCIVCGRVGGGGHFRDTTMTWRAVNTGLPRVCSEASGIEARRYHRPQIFGSSLEACFGFVLGAMSSSDSIAGKSA